MEVKLKQIKKPLILIAFGVILFLGLNNIGLLFNVLGRLMTILSPFLLGIAIAFILMGQWFLLKMFYMGEKGP